MEILMTAAPARYSLLVFLLGCAFGCEHILPEFTITDTQVHDNGTDTDDALDMSVEDVAEECVPEPETCDGVDNDCDGSIDEDFECAPGQSEEQPCGRCGTQTRQCSSSCTWDPWGACTGEGECTPAETQDQGCGNCGSQTRTCAENCIWGSWGPCTGEGVCSPASTQDCGSCGTQTCSSACTWEACLGDEYCVDVWGGHVCAGDTGMRECPSDPACFQECECSAILTWVSCESGCIC